VYKDSVQDSKSDNEKMGVTSTKTRIQGQKIKINRK
jgi:hypothetical protein